MRKSKINVEETKFIAHDAGWILVEDRPKDYFCRFADSETKPKRFVDVYYSRKGSVKLKQKKGNACYVRFNNTDELEDVFSNFYKYYHASHTILS